MTYEEAIQILVDLRYFDDDCVEDCVALTMAIEALEKQSAKKVGWTTDMTWGIATKQPVCPVCDSYLTMTYFIGDGKKITWCSHCGQAIDWGDTE